MDLDDRVQRDRLLRRAVLGGDQRAWQAWYDEGFDDLYDYIHWRCGAVRDRTDEVVQETWLTAVRRIRHFDPTRGSFLAWLRGIAANVVRNQLRRNRAGRLPAQLDGEPADDADRAERQHREQAAQIAAALDALPERHEAVLRAKYLESCSVAEIAARWQQTPKAIESLLSRARRGFRETYDKLHGDNGRAR